MCGLYASVGVQPERERLRRVAHRGPDGEQWEVIDTPAGPLALGHRRLAIIDLSDQAVQPMWTEDGRQVIIFNGEIYNYLELRQELIEQGCEFKTKSDCEVLLLALRLWGLSVLPRLRGMFAFVHFDRQTNLLTVARDSFGIKPLSYVVMPKGLAFASEQKQIFDLSGTSPKLNVSQVFDYLHSQTTDHSTQSMFAGLSHLAPGHAAIINLSRPLKGQKVEQFRWFDIPNIRQSVGTLEQTVTQFRHLFDQAIDRHLRSDVPAGACLSGGLDSSYVVARASQLSHQNGPLQTFTSVFPNDEIDERYFAEAVARHTRSVGNYVEIFDDQLKEQVNHIIWHQDEPFGSTSIFAQYFVFEAIAKAGLKVVLDGQGADEQLAGYHGVFPFHSAALLRQARISDLFGHLIGLKRHHNIPISDFFKQVGSHFLNKIGRANRVQVNRPNPLARGLAVQYRPSSGSTLQEIVRRNNLPKLETIGEHCLAMMMGGNLQMLLRYEDRNSMAHSVEARVPFLDSDLAAFSLGLGDRFKLVNGTTKFVARLAMAHAVPELILKRHSKLGFAAPETRWLRGPLRDHLSKGLTYGQARFETLIDWNASKLLLQELNDPNVVADPMLWRLANLGLWAERFDITL